MQLMSVVQAAEFLGVSRATAYRMVQEKKLPIVKILKRGLRIHRGKLEEMIDAQAAASICAAGGIQEEEECPTKETIRRSGGSLSPKQMENELDALLAQATTRPRRR